MTMLGVVRVLHGFVGGVRSENMGMTGLASAWAMVRLKMKEYHGKVDAATRCSVECPLT